MARRSQRGVATGAGRAGAGPSANSRRCVAAAAVGVILVLLAEPAFRSELRAPEVAASRAADGLERIGRDRVPWDLPVRITPEVERWIQTYTGPGRPYFEDWLREMTRFEGLIRRRLREREMPEDLVFVALIESGFRPGALSPARASGMWQFMEGTAREQGLRVDRWVDERLDPIRSTEAALDFLEALHGRFGSWYLAAAAYNAGPARVERALRQHEEDLEGEDGFWRIAQHLPAETRQHVPRLIASAVIGNAPQHFGFERSSRAPLTFERVFVPGGTRLRDVARAAGVDPDEIHHLNPHLIRGETPPDVLYPVRIPGGSASRTLAGLSIPSDDPRGPVLAGE